MSLSKKKDPMCIRITFLVKSNRISKLVPMPMWETAILQHQQQQPSV